MSKCNSITWLKITGMCNLDVIHICAIEACVWDFESLVSFVIFLCDDPCMESRYHNFILVRIQEYVWRWRISSDYGYVFVDSEKKTNKIMPNWHDLWEKILTMYDSSWDLTSGYSGPVPDLISKLKTDINIFTCQRLPIPTQSADTCDQVNIMQSICNTVLSMVLTKHVKLARDCMILWHHKKVKLICPCFKVINKLFLYYCTLNSFLMAKNIQ